MAKGWFIKVAEGAGASVVRSADAPFDVAASLHKPAVLISLKEICLDGTINSWKFSCIYFKIHQKITRKNVTNRKNSGIYELIIIKYFHGIDNTFFHVCIFKVINY